MVPHPGAGSTPTRLEANTQQHTTALKEDENPGSHTGTRLNLGLECLDNHDGVSGLSVLKSNQREALSIRPA